MEAGRSFLVHYNGSDIRVNYDSDYGLQGLKLQLSLRTGIPPDKQKIIGADDDRTISSDSDLVAVISGKLRLVSTSGNEGLLKSDEDFARMLQVGEKLKRKGWAYLMSTVMEGNLPLSNRQHSADQNQPSKPLELEKDRLVNEPSCDGSSNDTNGGMGVTSPSEILHGRYGDEIPREITDVLEKVLQVDGSGLKLESELQKFREQDRQRYIYFLSRILFCVDLENGIREFAGLLLRNELKDADDLVGPFLMDFIKTESLAIISSPGYSVRSTCQVISELARIAVNKLENWPQLNELIERSLHNEQLLTPAVLETFGYVIVEVSALGMRGMSRVQKILKALVHGMDLKNNDSVRLAATKAMCYALSIEQAILLSDRRIILKAEVEAGGYSNLNIEQVPFECSIILPPMVWVYLAFQSSHLNKIMEFTAVAVKEGKKDDAFRAIQFWSSLCEVEIDILKKTTCEVGSSFKCRYLIKDNSKDLVPLLLSLFDMEEIERDSEFDRALRLCLGYIAQAVGEYYQSFTNPVKHFINIPAGHKYLVKVISSTMGFVLDIFGKEEEADKEGKVANEMERGEGSQKPEKPEKEKELGPWNGLLLSRMTSVFKVLLDQDSGFLHKTMTETIIRYLHQDSISNPNALMRDESANYFESDAFSYLRETHGENLLGMFCKSWGKHLSMIQLLRLFFSVCGCHSKNLGTWVLSLAFPKITDAVAEVIDLASNEDKQIDKNLLESVTKILMAYGLHEAYEDNINGASARCAESIAMYCENLLKKGVSEEEMEKQLNMVSVVSKFYIDIGCFIEFYIKRACSRIYDVDLEQESRMLKMVREILFGGEVKYSSSLKNLEHIVNFIVSGQNEDKQKFEEYVVNRAIIRGGMVMNLATAPNNWSFKDASFKNIKLPQELVNMVEVITEFIQNTPRLLQNTPKQRGSRKFVQISYPLSSCTVDCMFGTEKIELDMSVMQAALLMLFDTTDTWIFSEMLTQLRISHEELVSLIHSLSQENNKLLIKLPNTDNFMPTDLIELNTNFTTTSPIPRPILEDNKRKNVVKRVNNDMSLTIQCMLMKVMKLCKDFGPMDREKLAGATIEKCAGLEKCGFVPTRADVDVSIASLIKKEYLLVDKNNNNKLWWNEE